MQPREIHTLYNKNYRTKLGSLAIAHGENMSKNTGELTNKECNHRARASRHYSPNRAK